MTSTDWSISETGFADISALMERCVTHGFSLDRFRLGLVDLIQLYDWHWFGITRVEINQRALALYRAYCAMRYTEKREAQITEAGYLLLILQSGPSCPESHAGLNGLVLSATDDFWDTHRPPFDWDCGCYLLGANSTKAAIRLGGDVEKSIAEVESQTDIRGELWRGKRPPNLQQLLGAIVNDEALAQTYL